MFGRVLDAVERGGNRLPHPFWIFLSLALLVVVLSWALSGLGISVEDPGSGDEVAVTSLVSGAGPGHLLTSAVTNFVEFPPLGLVLTIMLAIGLAQQVMDDSGWYRPLHQATARLYMFCTYRALTRTHVAY